MLHPVTYNKMQDHAYTSEYICTHT